MADFIAFIEEVNFSAKFCQLKIRDKADFNRLAHFS